MEISDNKQNVALVPFNFKFSRLYGEFVHSITLSGVLTSTAKVRLQFLDYLFTKNDEIYCTSLCDM